MKEMYQQDIDAIPGERWFPKESNFAGDMPEFGEIGVSVLK